MVQVLRFVHPPYHCATTATAAICFFSFSPCRISPPASGSGRTHALSAALDGLLFLKTFSAPRLKFPKTKRQRSYTVRSIRQEHESTMPFPPPHKLARSQLSLHVR